MKAVVSKVLSLDDTIRTATDHYYDDIIVDLNVTSVERVRKHLLKYGVVCKPSKQIEHRTGARHAVKRGERWAVLEKTG